MQWHKIVLSNPFKSKTSIQIYIIEDMQSEVLHDEKACGWVLKSSGPINQPTLFTRKLHRVYKF